MFEVGKQVICIRNTPSTSGGRVLLEKGKIYTVWGIEKSRCCGVVALDVGITYPDLFTAVCLCKMEKKNQTGTVWFASSRFAPIDNTKSDITAEELLEQLEPQHSLY